MGKDTERERDRQTNRQTDRQGEKCWVTDHPRASTVFSVFNGRGRRGTWLRSLLCDAVGTTLHFQEALKFFVDNFNINTMYSKIFV